VERQSNPAKKTHLDKSIVKTDVGKELDALLLGGSGESDSGLITSSLVGNEKSGSVESTGLGGRGSRGSSRSHHEVCGQDTFMQALTKGYTTRTHLLNRDVLRKSIDVFGGNFYVRSCGCTINVCVLLLRETKA
jgi:hypothetical protein